MKILIANKDNIRCNEIKALARRLNKNHTVTIASMATDSAYMGQAFSFKNVPTRFSPLLYKEVAKNSSWIGACTTGKIKVKGEKLAEFDNIAAYEFHSNPADAMSIMLSEVLSHDVPDIVICGLNNSINLGRDIYSASNTGMAMEAAYYGIPVIAVGVEKMVGGHSEAELENAVTFIEKNLEKFVDMKLPEHTYLSISIPTITDKQVYAGVRVVRMGTMTKMSTFLEKTDPSGEKYYWAKDALSDVINVKQSDTGNEAMRLFNNKFITIMPISYDATDFSAIDAWNKTVVVKIEEVPK